MEKNLKGKDLVLCEYSIYLDISIGMNRVYYLFHFIFSKSIYFNEMHNQEYVI